MKTIPQELQSDFQECVTKVTTHYENFSVVSVFIPTWIRPHFCSIYAFCRSVDDLGDEFDGNRLAALAAFEEKFERCRAGLATDPMFRALAYTMTTFEMDESPFRRLIEANRRDQTKHVYHTWDDLLDY